MNDPIEAEWFRAAAYRFQELTRHRALDGFPTVAPIAREIAALLGSLDLLHLHAVPIITLKELASLTEEATEHVQFMIDSHPPEQAFQHGVGLPQSLERNQANITSRRGQLLKGHRQIFDAASPIIAHQQTRLLRIAVAPTLTLDPARSIPPDRSGETVWRYMPLRNLFRCERACGLWLSSLERLRTWTPTAGAISDVREGDIPPVVERLRHDYAAAEKLGAKAVEKLRVKLGVASDDWKLMRQSLDFAFELTNTFVSSWCQKRNESSGLWTTFADGGNGIALKSTVGQLLKSEWRSPIDIFGTTGSNSVAGLILREVKYLAFDNDDLVPSINDLHLPLLKRDSFSEEHEVRLVAFTKAKIAAPGFSLHCNLHDVINEIVIGPRADFESTLASIENGAPDLHGIPITRSTLAPPR
jgi:hypothetical protein